MLKAEATMMTSMTFCQIKFFFDPSSCLKKPSSPRVAIRNDNSVTKNTVKQKSVTSITRYGRFTLTESSTTSMMTTMILMKMANNVSMRIGKLSTIFFHLAKQSDLTKTGRLQSIKIKIAFF